jgi:hypothetical protein
MKRVEKNIEYLELRGNLEPCMTCMGTQRVCHATTEGHPRHPQCWWKGSARARHGCQMKLARGWASYQKYHLWRTTADDNGSETNEDKKIILLYQRAPWNHCHHCHCRCHHQHPWKHMNV